MSAEQDHQAAGRERWEKRFTAVHRPAVAPDWRGREHWNGGRLEPCHLCRTPTHLLDSFGRPTHKVCAELDAPTMLAELDAAAELAELDDDE